MHKHATAALRYIARRRLPPGVYDVRISRPGYIVVAKSGLRPNERWVTLHPHGKGSDHYVRVLIRVKEDGTGHVIGGSDELRGLKLTRLRPERWQQSAEERRAARKERRRREEVERKAKERVELERASREPSFAREAAQRKLEREALEEERKAAVKKLQQEITRKRLEQIELAAELGLPGWADIDTEALVDPKGVKDQKTIAALEALGIDPELFDEDASLKAAVKGGAGMVVGRVRRKLTQGLKRLEREMVRELAENHELRAEVYGEEGAVAATEALETRLPGGIGYARRTREQAKAQGVTEEDARAKAREAAEERLQLLDQIDPERAAAARNAREVMQNMHGVADTLTKIGEGSGPKLEAELDPVAVRERAERVKGFLRAAQEAKRLEQQLRQYAGDTEEIAQAIQNRTPGAFDVDVSLDDKEFLAELTTTIEDATKLDLTRSFFDELEADEGGAGAEMQRALYGKTAHAAYAHLNGALLTTLGHSGLDRQVVDVLGLEAAAKLTAWRLQQSLDPEELAAVKEGLERYHDATSLTNMQDAVSAAQQAKALALEIALPEISDAASLVIAKELNQQRQHYLETAIRELGTALGAMEAGAALNLALSKPVEGLSVTFHAGADMKQIVLGLHAIGLSEEDYQLERTLEGSIPRVHLQRSGMDRLAAPGDPQELAKAARLEAIRAGALDQRDWLPAGFTRYPKSIHNDPERARPLAVPPGFWEGRAPAEALEEFVASRLADGYTPSDILREAGSIDYVLTHVPEAQRDAYLEALEALFPVADAEGKLRDINQDPELVERYEQMARAYVERRHPDDAPFHAQTIKPNNEATRQAAYLALTEDPRTQIAFTPPGELGNQEQQALRMYFYSELAGIDSSGRDKKRLQQELSELGPEPAKYGASLFGVEAVTPEWAEWNERRATILAAHGGPTAWEEFVAGMRGLGNAYEAVQEHMRGRVAERFARYHANLTGAPLRLGKAALAHGERLSVATDPERRRALLAEEQRRMADLRERVQGRFAAEGEGSVIEKLRERLKQEAAFGFTERALFAPAPAEQKLEPPKVADPLKERYSLGARAEGELAAILPYAKGGLEPTAQGLRIYPEVTMGKGTRFVQQQRAIKFAKAAGKSLMAMGMGCVDGSTVLEDALTGERHTFEEWTDMRVRPHVWALDETTGEVHIVQASTTFIKGYEMMYEVTTEGGRRIRVTAGHRFLTESGWKRLGDIVIGSRIAVCDADDRPARTRTAYDETPKTAFDPSLPPPSSPLRSPSLRDIRDRTSTPRFSAAFAPLPRPYVRASTPGVCGHFQQTPEPSQGSPAETDCRPHVVFSTTRAVVADPLPTQARPVAHPLCDAFHPRSNLAPYPSMYPLDVEHYSDTPRDSLVGCPQHYRSDDAQFRGVQGVSQEFLPSQGGAREYSRLSGLADGWGAKLVHNHLCQSFAHCPSKDGDPRTGNHPGLKSQSHSVCNGGKQPYSSPPVAQQSRAYSDRQRPMRVSGRHKDLNRYASQVSFEHIIRIIELDRALVYDITVPTYHNYIAHGIISHNSGKTSVQVATFTELHAEGKARKALMVTPSVVRNQFAEEMARFTEPGRYKWHATDAPFEERLRAYQDPDTHINVVTHQTFRDDLLRLMTSHFGYDDRDDLMAHLERADPQERRRMLRSTLAANNMEPLLDYVAMDEAHEALGREGKPDSFLQMVTDAALQESRYAVAATGTPVKNDPSEVHSWLEKLDPDRWQGRADEFKRRFGLELNVTAEAFKRAAGRYIFASTIPSGVHRKEVWGVEDEQGISRPLALSDVQRQRLERVNTAFERARQARREGRADLNALKELSPDSFAGRPEGEHQAIAERLSRSIGTLRFAAQARAINAAPAQHNAKIQHILKLARERRQRGQPGVVFAHSLTAVSEIAKALEADGHRVAVVTGADSSARKAEKRQMFHPDQGEPEVDVLVMSDAGAVGMNLQRGRWLINHDVPLTYKTLTQRNARIDRIGQRADVEVHNLITDTAYDHAAVRRVQHKGLLQDIFESDWESMDENGLALAIILARRRREFLKAA